MIVDGKTVGLRQVWCLCSQRGTKEAYDLLLFSGQRLGIRGLGCGSL